MTKLESEYWRTCFVVMAYGKRKVGKQPLVDFDTIYQEIFQKAIKTVKVDHKALLVPKRADDASHSRLLLHGMMQDLCRSRLMLADLSTDNTNVGLEVGIRYSMVPTGNVLVQLKGTLIPFDLAATQVTQYSNAPPDEIPVARKRIAKVLRDTLRHNELDNPYYHYGQELARQMGNPENPTDLGKLLVGAEQAVRRRDLKAAIDKYAKAEQIEPTLAPLYLRRASLLIEGRFMEAAKVELQKAIKLNPDFLEARRWLEEIKRGKVPKPVYMGQTSLVSDARQPKQYGKINKLMAPSARVKVTRNMLASSSKRKFKRFSGTRKKSASINNPDNLEENSDEGAVKGVKKDSIRSGRREPFSV